MAVEPGTAQNIPVFAKYIILGLCILAVTLTAGWSKFIELLKGKKRQKS